MTPDRSPRTICARCGQIVIDHRTTLTVESAADVESIGQSFHLCLDCTDRLRDWLRARRREPQRGRA